MSTPTLREAAQALKPCPFCGGAAAFVDACEPRKPLYWAECQTCGIGGLDAVTVEAATEKWNRRAVTCAAAEIGKARAAASGAAQGDGHADT